MLQLPSEGDGVLILDDTGFAKPGHCSVGVARQYSGTLGKIGNCPVTVNCHSAERTMAWPVATRLYLPKGWASDADRRRKAKVPAAVAFRTEPQIALELLDRAWGVRWACVTVDAGSGDHPNFLDGLEAHRQRSVVAVRCDFTVTCLLLSFAGVRPPTSRPAPRASDFEPSDDRLPVPTRALDFPWAVRLPVGPRSFRTLPIRLVLIVPSFPASRHAASIAFFPASGWSTFWGPLYCSSASPSPCVSLHYGSLVATLTV